MENSVNYAMDAAWRCTRPYVLLLPAVIVMVMLFVVPMENALSLSLQGADGEISFEWYTRFLASAYVEDLLFTLAVGFGTAILCVILSLPLAFLLTRPFWGRTALYVIVLIPLVVPHIIAAYAIWLALMRRGPVFAILVERLHLLETPPLLVTQWTGLVIALVWKFFPITTLTIAAALETLDQATVDAARDLGAGRWRRLLEIILPLLTPGILAGFALVFILATAQFTITLIVYTGTRITTIPLGIYFETIGFDRWEYGSALGIVLTLVTLTSLGVITRVIRGAYRATVVD
jgi:ABC-type spermidine/putrescine transport system permease subunit I